MMNIQTNILLWLPVVFFSICIPGVISAGFQSPLQNRTAIAGSTVALKCKIKSDGKAIRRTWTNNTSLIFADSVKYRVDDRIELTKDSPDEYTIQLRSITRYDEGKYTCKLYLEPPQESSMYLTVHVPPQISPDIKTNVEVDEGSDVTLKCKATGRPKPEITWRHLVPSADRVWATGSHLPLSKISRESAGAYECTANNKVSAPDTRRIQVTVRYPPELDERKGKLIVEQALGLKATLECTAMSVPEPEFEWVHPSLNKYPDGSVGRIRVLNFKRGGTVTSRLLISEVGLRDFGNYTCNARNRMGLATKIILLKRIILPATRPPPSYFSLNMFGRSDDGDKRNSALSHKLSSTFKFLSFFIPLLSTKISNLH